MTRDRPSEELSRQVIALSRPNVGEADRGVDGEDDGKWLAGEKGFGVGDDRRSNRGTSGAPPWGSVRGVFVDGKGFGGLGGAPFIRPGISPRSMSDAP